MNLLWFKAGVHVFQILSPRWKMRLDRVTRRLALMMRGPISIFHSARPLSASVYLAAARVLLLAAICTSSHIAFIWAADAHSETRGRIGTASRMCSRKRRVCFDTESIIAATATSKGLLRRGKMRFECLRNVCSAGEGAESRRRWYTWAGEHYFYFCFVCSQLFILCQQEWVLRRCRMFGDWMKAKLNIDPLSLSVYGCACCKGNGFVHDVSCFVWLYYNLCVFFYWFWKESTTSKLNVYLY